MSWGSEDLERHPKLTLISGCYSSLCKENSQREIKQDRLAKNQRQIQRGTVNTKFNVNQKQNRKTGLGFNRVYLLMYSHPTQLLIRRKGPSWDHLDGVLLQSSGTKHTHRPLRRGINNPKSQRYLCCILHCCLFPGGSNEGKLFQIRHFDDRCQSLSHLSELLPSLTVWYTHRHTSKHSLNCLGSAKKSQQRKQTKNNCSPNI